jgi:hypothetical protein
MGLSATQARYCVRRIDLIVVLGKREPQQFALELDRPGLDSF